MAISNQTFMRDVQMKKWTILFSVIFIGLLAIFISLKTKDYCSQLTEVPGILKSVPFEKTMLPYEELPIYSTYYLNEEKYKELLEIHRTSLEGQRCDITYLSDGLKVKGVAVFPKNFDSSKKYPLIVYNRGGNREFGRIIEAYSLREYLALDRYVVFASQYRGNAGGEGRDEFGGLDVHDVINLTTLAKNLEFIDAENTFMVGISRGGMMTYLALKEGVLVNAAVVRAGVSDLFLLLKNRPGMEASVFEELIPSYKENKEKVLSDRSIIFEADKINSPLLLIHGTDDKRVSVEQSKKLATKLELLGKKHKLILYEGDGHFLKKHWKEALEEVHQWLSVHLK